MTLTTLQFIDDDAVRAAYPEVRGQNPNGDYHDNNGNKVTIDDSVVAAKKTELINEYNAEQYKRDRAKEYPSVVDQLDDIYHNGIDGWKATIKATKDKYPKP